MWHSSFGSLSHSRVSQMAGKNSDETNSYMLMHMYTSTYIQTHSRIDYFS
jgi:hypothetical protein